MKNYDDYGKKSLLKLSEHSFCSGLIYEIIQLVSLTFGRKFFIKYFNVLLYLHTTTINDNNNYND